ncbi:MAG: carboxypeptidase-like regulatory domain-containing protein, partial [Candidatus Acidiferrales bacterium]
MNRWGQFFKGVSALAFFAVILLASPLARAQGTAAINGTVSDPSGAVVPGASITVTNEATNA